MPRPFIVQLIFSRFLDRRPKFTTKSDLENRKHHKHIVASKVHSYSQNGVILRLKVVIFSAEINSWRGVSYLARLANDNRSYNACPAGTSGGVSPVVLFLSSWFYLKYGFLVWNTTNCGFQKYENTYFSSIDGIFDKYWASGILRCHKTWECGVRQRVNSLPNTLCWHCVSANEGANSSR